MNRSTFDRNKPENRGAAVVSIAVILVAGILDPLDVLGALSGSLRSSEIDALFFVVPPYFALAVLAGLLIGSNAERTRSLAAISIAVTVVATLAHSFGLVSCVDRTPRHFPWQLMFVVGVLSVVCIGVLIHRSRRADEAKRVGFIVAANAVLLIPLSIYFVALALHRFAFAYAVHWVGHASLGAVSFHWMRNESSTSSKRRLPAARWLLAGLISVGVAALPFWPSLVTVRKIYVDRETCGYAPSFGSLWQVVQAGDSVCSNLPGYLFAITVLALAAAGFIALVVWALRSPE